MQQVWKKQACRGRVHVHPLPDQAPGARQGEVRPKTGHGGMCSLWIRLDLRRRGAVLFLCRTGGGQRTAGAEERGVETALHGEAPGWNLYRLRGKKPWRIEVPAVRPEIIRQIEPLPRDAGLGTRIHRGGPGHRGRARALRQPGRRGRRRRVSQAPDGGSWRYCLCSITCWWTWENFHMHHAVPGFPSSPNCNCVLSYTPGVDTFLSLINPGIVPQPVFGKIRADPAHFHPKCIR